MLWGSLRAVDLSRAHRDVFWYSHARKSSDRQVMPDLHVAEGRALQFAVLDDAHVLLPVDARPLRFAQVVETPSEDDVEGVDKGVRGRRQFHGRDVGGRLCEEDRVARQRLLLDGRVAVSAQAN